MSRAKLLIAPVFFIAVLLVGCGPTAVAEPPTPTPTGPAGHQTAVTNTQPDRTSVENPEPNTATPEPTPPEPAVRQHLERMACGPSGICEVVPGFGGIFLELSTVYVYMLDPSQQELAEEAARIMLGRERFERENIRVRVLQADYSISQLNEWYERMWNVVHSVEGVSSTDLNEGKNRIAIGMTARLGAGQEMEELMTSLDIPLEAVLIEVGCRDTGQPYQPPSWPDDPALSSLKVWVEAPAQVEAGEPVPFTSKIKNTGDRPVNMLSRGTPTPDFVVVNPDGSKVWGRWCEVGFLNDSGRTLTLEPGQVIEHQARWMQWDGRGEPVSPGTFLVYGVSDTHPRLATEPATFEITP